MEFIADVPDFEDKISILYEYKTSDTKIMYDEETNSYTLELKIFSDRKLTIEVVYEIIKDYSDTQQLVFESSYADNKQKPSKVVNVELYGVEYYNDY